jgi:16S rRNA (cytidine1402-2'-O)-methyltransferase
VTEKSLPDQRQFVVAGHAIPAGRIAPGLHIVATPIGNLADVTIRALSTLAGADLVYCEDTRMSRRLLERYAIRVPVSAYHEHNAQRLRPVILEQLKGGGRLALVSDAGMPLISDPGYKLVRECVEEGFPVHVVPGPSAPLMALVLSGLPTDRFTFAGFLPNRSGARRTMLAGLAGHGASLIFFDTAPRVAASLADIAEVLGDPPVALARELTKMHEEVLRGRASEVAAAIAARGGLKGEITLVVAPPEPADLADDAEIDEALSAALAEMTPGKAASQLARRFGRPRRELYRRALALKGDGDADDP